MKLSRKTFDPASPRTQVAALPWRSNPNVEILVASSRETRRWVLPKGWPMKGLSAQGSAEREALEEAGIEGIIATEAIGSFHYIKRMKNGSAQLISVDVYPMQVTRQRKNWPEKHERTTRWLTVEAAAAAVHEPERQELICVVGASLQSQGKAAQLAAG